MKAQQKSAVFVSRPQVDLWMSRSSDGYEGPARGVNNPKSHCNLGAPSDLGSAPEFCDFKNESTCKAYPGYPVRKTPLFAPFIYKMHLFTKTEGKLQEKTVFLQGEELQGCTYEDQLFEEQVIQAIQKKDPVRVQKPTKLTPQKRLV
jgi:hypothetical protein